MTIAKNGHTAVLANNKGEYTMKTMTIPVFFATDDAYAPALGVALRSLLDNTKGDNDIRIHILSTSLSEENRTALCEIAAGRASIHFVNMHERIAPLADRLVLRDYYSAATYLRLFISEMYPEYDKALYLDCDIVVTGDIADLYSTPTDDVLVAAVPEDVMWRIDVFGRYVETLFSIPRREFFNAGVLVMNLDRFRRDRILDRFLDLLSRRRFVVTQDEDYLNVLCRGAVRLLPDAWNTSPLEEGEVTPQLVHYKLDRKPWHYGDVRFSDEFWHYADKTPYGKALRAELSGYDNDRRERDRQSYERLVELAKSEILRERRERRERRESRLSAVTAAAKRCTGLL